MFAEDTTLFFDTATGFGSTATVGGVPNVGVIFDNAYAQSGVGFIGMASSQPAITLPDAAVPAQPVGATVLITQGPGLGSYVVASSEPDGTGITKLFLELAA